MLKKETLTGSYDAGKFFRAKDLLGKEIRIKDGKLEVSVEPLNARCIVLDKVNVNS